MRAPAGCPLCDKRWPPTPADDLRVLSSRLTTDTPPKALVATVKALAIELDHERNHREPQQYL